MQNDKTPDDDSSVGYQKPPVHSRYKKGQSGNPRGRPKKKPTFLDDAVSILGAPVTGQAKGKPKTLAMEIVLFRRLCRNALKGDNAALRQVIGLILVLEPEALEDIKLNAEKGDEARRKFALMLGLDPDRKDDSPREPSPEYVAWEKRADELAKVERKRLYQKARQQGRI